MGLTRVYHRRHPRKVEFEDIHLMVSWVGIGRGVSSALAQECGVREPVHARAAHVFSRERGRFAEES